MTQKLIAGGHSAGALVRSTGFLMGRDCAVISDPVRRIAAFSVVRNEETSLERVRKNDILTLGKAPKNDTRFGNIRLAAIERSGLMVELSKVSLSQENQCHLESDDRSVMIDVKIPVGERFVEFKVYWAVFPALPRDYYDVHGLTMVLRAGKMYGGRWLTQKLQCETRTHDYGDRIHSRCQLNLAKFDIAKTIEVYGTFSKKD